MNPVLEIKNLSVEYHRLKKTIPAVRDVSLTLNPGETLGIAGESGCGKSTVALSILRLIAPHEGQITGGEILFEGKNILELLDEEMRSVRGKEIGIVFQDLFSSFNPVIKIGEQIAETILIHDPQVSIENRKKKVMELLSRVRLPDPERIYDSYPHQVSGGQRQRAMIAMAIANHPKLLIADEPTTALDVTVQKEILDLLKTLQKEMGMAIILITHHIGIIAQYTESLAVLYAGEVAEEGRTAEMMKNPQHPYTQLLLKSLPKRKMVSALVESGEKKQRLPMIPGSPPDLLQLPAGCIFHPRCPYVIDECRTKVPGLRPLRGMNRKVTCHLAPFENEVSAVHK